MFKKFTGFVFIMILALLFSSSAWAGSGGRIHTRTMFDAEAFEASTAEYSKDSSGNAIILDLNDYEPNGFFSVQVYLNDADGSMTLEWEVSNDKVNFTEPLDADGNRVPDIQTSFAYNGGKGSDGREFLPIPKPTMGRWARLKATPSAHAITGYTVILTVQ